MHLLLFVVSLSDSCCRGKREMGGFTVNNPWAFTCSIIGSVISGVLFLTPLLIFYGVYLEGWIEGLTAVPYIISLFTCLLKIYYALINGSEYVVLLIISIVGLFFCIVYITLCLIYSPKEMRTCILIMTILAVGLFMPIFLITFLLWKGEERIHIIGWIYLVCLTFSSVLSPFSTLWQVIKTRSIKGMPFYDPLLTTCGAASWLAYAILMKNINIAVPNAMSLVFGVIQMVVYMKYKHAAPEENVDSLQLRPLGLPRPAV